MATAALLRNHINQSKSFYGNKALNESSRLTGNETFFFALKSGPQKSTLTQIKFYYTLKTNLFKQILLEIHTTVHF